MGTEKSIQHFKDLIVYRKARRLATEIFALTKSFPKEEAYSLTSQIRRSSRSIGAQLAEAWGKRRYKRHFLSKLTDADSEQNETQHWLGIAADCRYIDRNQAIQLVESCQELGRMIAGIIAKRNKFLMAPLTGEKKFSSPPIRNLPTIKRKAVSSPSISPEPSASNEKPAAP